MKPLVVRKLDAYNFVLAEELDTPKTVVIKDREITYNYKNKELYYGTLYDALCGMTRHSKTCFTVDDIPLDLESIKPNDSNMVFLEVGDEQIKELFASETNYSTGG